MKMRAALLFTATALCWVGIFALMYMLLVAFV